MKPFLRFATFPAFVLAAYATYIGGNTIIACFWSFNAGMAFVELLGSK